MQNSLFKIFFISTIFFYQAIAFSDVHVKGYYKKNGTYVAPHYRSSPNQTTSDNWSTKGNTNPYTGKQGTKSTTQTGGFIDTNNEFTSKYIYKNAEPSPFIIYKWIDKNNITHYSDRPPP